MDREPLAALLLRNINLPLVEVARLDQQMSADLCILRRFLIPPALFLLLSRREQNVDMKLFILVLNTRFFAIQ